jgi:hypothetical protein
MTPATVEVEPPPFGGRGGGIKERLRPLEWVATVAAGALFVAIMIFLIWGMYDWTKVGAPQFAGGLTEQTQAIANFKALADVELDRVAKVLDIAVTKTLLPVFTTVIGYLLGKREG